MKKAVRFCMFIIMKDALTLPVHTEASSIFLDPSPMSVTKGARQKNKIFNAKETVKWKSSNKKIARVKKTGKNTAVITGKKAGKVIISAFVDAYNNYYNSNETMESLVHIGSQWCYFDSPWVNGTWVKY